MDNRVTEYANSIFEQPWWLDIVAKDVWEEVYAEENGNVLARLPFVKTKSKSGNTIHMPSLTQTLGIWMANIEKEKGNKRLAKQKELIDTLLDQLPEAEEVYICLDHKCNYVLPCLWKGYKIVPHYSYRIQDLTDLDKVYENFGKIVKKNIKSAKNKVRISYETDVDQLYRMLEITFLNQGKKYPHSKKLIEEIVLECEKRNAGKMISAIDEKGNVHACSYFIYDQNVCYYLISGSNQEFRASGAQTLILWEGIQFASKVSREFDFEGSMIEGIENFFRAFGGDLVVNYGILKQSFRAELYDVLRPKLKKLFGRRV